MHILIFLYKTIRIRLDIFVLLLQITLSKMAFTIFSLTDVWFMVCKMTAQNTRSQQKKQKRPSLPGGRDICKNVSKSGGLVWLGVFGQFFVVFSAPRQARTFPFFSLSPCVLCGHFDYNKPMFQDKKYFGPRGGWPIFKPPVSWVFREKKIYGDNFMVQHNPNNHFQGVNPKFSLNLISAPPCVARYHIILNIETSVYLSTIMQGENKIY